MSIRHLIDFTDFTAEQWREIIKLSLDIKSAPKEYSHSLSGKILATMFYEPSTRTQMSFQTAMFRMGGQVIGFNDGETSSAAKGECVKDTVLMVSGYADVIAVRHPREGAAKAMSLYSACPVINAGDGGHLHPTQTLADLVTLYEKAGRTDNLTIGFCGDLKYGRTVHSLAKALCRNDGNKFVFISDKSLSIPDYVKAEISRSGCAYSQTDSLEQAIGDLDVLYMTRIQKERNKRSQRAKNKLILSGSVLDGAKKDMLVMHPLPRVDEITKEVDSDPRAVYFEQAYNGLYSRMALLLKLHSPEFLNTDKKSDTVIYQNAECLNKNCITVTDGYLPAGKINKDGKYYCEYCEHECK
ncbi:MAG: aspartate carbamoyltransferase [Oscillospiraceae bacterium]|nr:aspartate carbamoyltransferase [Oscillospiraceae bacterium]